MKTALTTLILLITSLHVFAQQEALKEGVLIVNNQLYEAVWKADTQTRRKIAAADLIYISYEGEVLNRKQWIAKVRKPARPNDSYRIDDVQIDVHGYTATVTGRLITLFRGEDKYGFKEGRGQYRYTDLYVIRQNRWRLIVSHLKPIEKHLWQQEIFDEMRPGLKGSKPITSPAGQKRNR